MATRTIKIPFDQRIAAEGCIREYYCSTHPTGAWRTDDRQDEYDGVVYFLVPDDLQELLRKRGIRFTLTGSC